MLTQAASAAEIVAGSLGAHPTLLAFAQDLCGMGYFADLPLLPVRERYTGSQLVGGDSCIDPSREYFHQPEGYFTAGGNQDYEHVATSARVRQCQVAMGSLVSHSDAA